MTEAKRAGDIEADNKLIERWRSGDQRAASIIVSRHAPALSRFALSLGVRDAIDEIVQDTFVRAFGALDSFRSESSLRTWLFTIERRLIYDRARAMRRRPEMVEIIPEDAVYHENPLDGIVAEETENKVLRAMKDLSPMQRNVFTLRVQEGRSYKDIAAILGSTEGAARVHYHNALRVVKESLNV